MAVLDAGLTGRDWIEESEAKVHAVADLIYAQASFGRCAGCLRSGIVRLSDREGSGKGKIIATELVPPRSVIWRPTESAPRWSLVGRNRGEAPGAGRCDRGSDWKLVLHCAPTSCASLKLCLNRNTQLIANTGSWRDPWKRRKMEDVRMLLEGAINALGKGGADAERAPRLPACQS